MIETPFGELTWSQLRYAAGVVVVFVAMFAISLLLIGWLMVRLPASYFLDSHRRDTPPRSVRGWAQRIGKNLAGVALVVIGVVLSLPGVPGQGMLTILVGLILLDLPGKRRLECAILRRPTVRAAVDRLRVRYGKPPLVLEEPE